MTTKAKSDAEIFSLLASNSSFTVEEEQKGFKYSTFYANNSEKVKVSRDNAIVFINKANKVRAHAKSVKVTKFLDNPIVEADKSPGLNQFTWSRMDTMVRMKLVMSFEKLGETERKEIDARLHNWLLEFFNLNTVKIALIDSLMFKCIAGGNLHHFMSFKSTAKYAYALACYQHARKEELKIGTFDTAAQLNRLTLIGDAAKTYNSEEVETLLKNYFQGVRPKIKVANQDRSDKYNNMLRIIKGDDL